MAAFYSLRSTSGSWRPKRAIGRLFLVISLARIIQTSRSAAVHREEDAHGKDRRMTTADSYGTEFHQDAIEPTEAGSSYDYFFELFHKIPDLCWDGSNETAKTTFQGDACNRDGVSIKWKEVSTKGTSNCDYDRSTASDNEIAKFLGDGCAKVPTAVTMMPTKITDKIYSFKHKEAELCGTSTGSTRTHWYGTPCANDPDLIQWNWMQTDDWSEPDLNPCNDDDPQNNIWKREDMTDDEQTAYFGSCGVGATSAPLPTHTNFVHYILQHRYPRFCGNPDGTLTKTIFLGHECNNATEDNCKAGDLLWDRTVSYRPKSDETYCNSTWKWFDPLTANLMEHPSLIGDFASA